MGAVDPWILVHGEASVRYHSDVVSILTGYCESRSGTVSVGQFDWGGRLLKSSGGAQWFPQVGRKSTIERKGRRELD